MSPEETLAAASEVMSEDAGWEWAIVEIFGHRRHAGRTREEVLKGLGLVSLFVAASFVASIARRDAKWRTASLRCAGQTSPPVQRHAAWSSARASAEPHSGHTVGICHGCVPCGRLSSTTRTISGITSPARRTITVSPTRTSLRAISSSSYTAVLKPRRLPSGQSSPSERS